MLKSTVKIPGYLALVLLLAIGGLLIWLRTEAAERYLAGKLTNLLAGQGIALSYGRLSGPLPGRLTARNLILSDSQGEFLKVETLEIKLKLSSLLFKTLEIEQIYLAGADLLRLPELPATDQPPPDKGDFSLPLNIRLNNLTLANNLIRFGAFDQSRAQEPGRDILLEAQGQAELGSERLWANLEASLTTPDQKGLWLSLSLEPAEAAADSSRGAEQAERLILNLKAAESEGGLLAALSGRPDWPAYDLRLTGEGLLTDWQGRLGLTAGPEGQFLQAGADLAWQGRTGELWRDAVAGGGFKAGLTSNLTVGPKGPDSWRQLFGDQLTAGFDLEREKNRFSGEVKLQAEPWNLNITDFQLQPNPAGGRELEFNLTGQATDPGRILAALGRPASTATGFFSALALSSRIQAAQAGGQSSLTAQGRLDVQPQTKADQPWPLDFDLSLLEEPGQSRLARLALNGLGLSIQAQGSHWPAAGGLKADLSAQLTAGAPWRELAAQLTGQDQAESFDGQVDLELNLDWPGSSAPARGGLDLKAAQLRWPWAELRPWAGPSLRLAAELSGGGGQPYHLELKEAATGPITIQGAARLIPAQANKPLVLKNSRFQLEAEAGLSETAFPAAGWSGPLSAHFTAKGRPHDLNAALRLTSPSLKMPEGELQNLEVLWAADLKLPAPELFQAAGHLRAKAEARPGGELKADSNWNLAKTEDGYAAALAGTLIDGGGVKLTADLSGHQPGPLKTGLLAGQFELAVQDWAFPAAGLARPLAGAPAHLKATLAHQDGRQNVRLDLSLPELKLRGAPGQPEALALNKVNGLMEATDIFQEPALDFKLSSGPGLAGPLNWSSGLATVTGGRAGNLKIDFRRAGENLLALQGHYDLTAAALTLSRLNFLWPDSKSGLSLEKPATLAWKNGFEVKGLSVAVKPGGRLTAEAAFKNEQTELKAALLDLPPAFFQPFIESSLPEGVLKAQLNLSGRPRQANGDFALTAALKTPARNRRNNGRSTITLNLNGRLADSSLKGAGQLSLGERGREPGELTYRLPLTVSETGLPGLDLNSPLRADFKWRGSLARIWQVLPWPDRNLSGRGEIRLGLGGSFNQLKPEAKIYIAGGRYEDLVIGLLLDNINLEAHNAADGSIRALLEAGDARQGRAALEGHFRPGQAENPANLAARSHFTNFQPFQRDDFAIRFSGLVRAEGPLSAPIVNGRLVVEQGEYSLLSAMGGGSVRTLPLARDADVDQDESGGPSCDLDIIIPNQFYVRGRGLDSEWQGDLKIQGPLSSPVLTGSIKPVRGHFELLSKEFAITAGDIRFSGGPRLNPGLHLEMTHTGPRATAVVLVEGTVNNPKLTLTSRPPYPQDEVLAQVLFGKSATALSRFEALQLAQGLRELAGMNQGKFSILSTARKAFGLDVLRIGSSRGESSAGRISDLSGSRDLTGNLDSAASSPDSEAGETTIEAGKYLSDKVYVGVEQGLGTGDVGVRVEVELRPNLSLEGRTSADSSQVGLGWKKDY